MARRGIHELEGRAGLGTYVFVVFLMVVALFPVYWLIVTSLKPSDQLVSSTPSLIAFPPVLEHYVALFRGSEFPTYVLNSFLVATSATLISTILSTSAAYSVTRLNYRFRRAIAKLVLLTYMFPGVLLLVPLYTFLSEIGLLDNLLGLTLVYVTWCAPFSTWILIGFFRSIPMDLENAALVDGASRFEALMKVLLPLSAPGILTAMIFSFVSAWNEYPLAVTLITSEANKTLPVGLSAWINLYSIEWGTVSAGGVITILPILVLFAVMGRRFVAGMTEGAVKG